MHPFVGFLFPQLCQVCEQPSASAMVCDACYGDLARNHCACPLCGEPMEVAQVCAQCLAQTPPMDGIFAPFLYQGPMQHWILQLKHHQQLFRARTLAEVFALELTQKKTPRVEAILPIPLHPQRLKQRGFNQTLEVAKFIANNQNIPLIEGQLQRQKNTISQQELSRQARQANMQNAFYIHKKQHLANLKRIALLDDVMTTGATLYSGVTCLKDAYPHLEVEIWVLARAGKLLQLPTSPE